MNERDLHKRWRLEHTIRERATGEVVSHETVSPMGEGEVTEHTKLSKDRWIYHCKSRSCPSIGGCVPCLYNSGNLEMKLLSTLYRVSDMKLTKEEQFSLKFQYPYLIELYKLKAE